MNFGMLWFDNDPKAELTVKIQRAASYYQDKYGQFPNICLVHPSMIRMPSPTNEGGLKTSGIEIRPNRSVLPNHLWIGVVV
jgi:hypothetical protein